jgi:hypothetical protein
MKKSVLAGIIIFFIPFFCLAQTHPRDFLGHEVGADKKLADYNQIMAYFQKLETETPMLKLLTIGQTTLKKPMIMAVITTEKNMADLTSFQEIARSLRDARGLSEEQAREMAKKGKSMVLITCSQHSSEIAASQMTMELAYDLVTGNTEYDATKILDDVIVLLVPTSNPDGHQLVTEWYRKNLDTKYQDARMPWLYHHYAGHDNNRDWFMFNLKETQAITKVLYHDWIPQIHIDEHQMGSTGARLFLPPFMDPPVPNVHPLVWRGIALFGTSMAYDLQKNDFKGVVYGRSFTGWWIGACDDTSWLHNSIGILSEMASVNTASPIYIDPTELPESYVEKRMQFPDPWPGGWWRLRNLVDYELNLSKTLIRTAAQHREALLFNFYKMNRDNINWGQQGGPFAFVIPKTQADMPTTLRMLEILKTGGVEIHQAEADFLADGRLFPAGSFVVYMAQPYRPYAQALLEKQIYPDMRQYPGGPPVPPYDNAGWTLPLQMGVSCRQIDHVFKAQTRIIGTVPWPDMTLPETGDSYLLLDSQKNVSYSAVFPLLAADVEVFRTTGPVKTGEFDAAAGSFLVKNSPEAAKILAPMVEKKHIPVQTIGDITDIPKSPLKKHRVGLYQSWRSNADEGWTRYMLDDLEIPFTTLHNKDFKGDAKKKTKVNLLAKYDVIVFASEGADIIKDGKRSSDSPYARGFSVSTPPEYEGGIGKEGVEALKAFVEGGGILVTLNQACELAFKEFSPPAQDALGRVDRSKFFCPTSILRVKVNNLTPIGYGFGDEAAVMFSRSLGLSTRVPSGDWDRTVVASYPKKDVLLSGWLLGEDQIARKSAVVDTKFKKGHIILIGIRCQHRAQSHGAYKFMLNALLYPEIN